MNLTTELTSETFAVKEIELYNWGGFSGRHQAMIDPDGTAIIGPTGSGKTTLVDALMTLLCAFPKYNFASTGGTESDRDLVSYVRGAISMGEQTGDSLQTTRRGKTTTALSITLRSSTKLARLGALLWFEDTSSATSELHRTWIFTTAEDMTLEYWLQTHHEGGARALKQLAKDQAGIWTFPSKSRYLARIREYFDVGENAFDLLNRAAGLKQLSDMNEIFRELVLDDHSAFDRAGEVIASFADLSEIHEELNVARRQQQSLLPIESYSRQYNEQEEDLKRLQALRRDIPIWFAEQASILWSREVERLNRELEDTTQQHHAMEREEAELETQITRLRDTYLELGGGDIDSLQHRLNDLKDILRDRENNQRDYAQLVKNLEWALATNELEFVAQQGEVAAKLEEVKTAYDQAEAHHFDCRVEHQNAVKLLNELKAEQKNVLKSPDSNVPGDYQAFRQSLQDALGLSEADVPFVAELVEVKVDQSRWRGAIERALGGQRLRIVVPENVMSAALKWVNERNNRLFVRLLEHREPDSAATFFDDGYARKLNYKVHPYREAVKSLIAANDRHCVDQSDDLRRIPHSMTDKGLMSGRRGFFEKQDQRNLKENWLTGFSNKDRLEFLANEIEDQTKLVETKQGELNQAHTELQGQKLRLGSLEALQRLQFHQIDVGGTAKVIAELKDQLLVLTRPDSAVSTAKQQLDDAHEKRTKLREQLGDLKRDIGRLESDTDKAKMQLAQSQASAPTKLNAEEQQAVEQHLAIRLIDKDLLKLPALQREAESTTQALIDRTTQQLNGLAQRLASAMTNAQKEDRGSFTEIGTELDDIPVYLERLQVLSQEALPAKLERFTDYLNRSSDEGVNQLLSHVENEVSMIEERLEDLNATMQRVDFEKGRYLKLAATRIAHESLKEILRAQRHLASARTQEDEGQSHYKALTYLVELLSDACERRRTTGARALLDPRYRLEFKVVIVNRDTGNESNSLGSSQGGSGGEKEIIASFVLTASLSYALCPDGSAKPLFGTIVLDEAFSRSSHTVAGRIIAALREFGLHAIFVTPNKEMRLLRNHTRSAIVVHRRQLESSLAALSWEEISQLKTSNKGK
ncbi:MAG: ATP-binding protein [Pseudomonadales bacterium]